MQENIRFKLRIIDGRRRLNEVIRTHRGEGVEETSDVSHDTTFIWPVRITQIRDLEELLYVTLRYRDV